jgi:hypothetical protein
MKIVGKQKDGKLIFQIITALGTDEERHIGELYISGETLEDFGEENLFPEELERIVGWKEN